MTDLQSQPSKKDSITDDAPDPRKGMGLFERFLTVWVALAIIIGIGVGQFMPFVPETLSQFEYAQVSIPVAVLIWAMIFPMMLQIDFASILGIRRQPKGLIVTTTVNWLIKPFTMFAIAWFFLLFVFSPLIPEELAASIWPARSCSGRRRVPRWSSSGATSRAATRRTPLFRSR